MSWTTLPSGCGVENLVTCLAFSQVPDERHRTRPDKTATMGVVMAWLVLLLSGALEAVWAVALGRSEGFSRLGPSLVFLVALAASMGGLALALRSIPVGTAYAVWVGIGAALTVIYGMITGTEPVTLVRLLLIAGLIGCALGLKLTH